MDHAEARRSSDVPVPQAKKGEVLVEVYSTGVNFFEYVCPNEVP